jgi:hypothetical protein
MKYTIKKVFEIDGIWFRAYSNDSYVLGTVSDDLSGCEKKLRYVLSAEKEKPVFMKELEIP